MDYPKMLYKDGQAYNGETGQAVPHQNTLVVNSAEEEAEAAAGGFLPLALTEVGDDTLTAPAGDETLSGAAGDETLAGGEGADEIQHHPADAEA